ncbi:unannotated protein [freshwater metagenome]|uniref:Unannotated protein n=1 Tax=freshwater metagenome TaxID=449393 RepID=A0A6J7FYD0_9ZZZZ
MVAGAGNVEHGERLGSLPRGNHECRGSPLEGSHALLHHFLCGVHDARVDVSKLGQCEEVLGMLGAVEHV